MSTVPTTGKASPKHQLQGIQLASGWVLGAPLPKTPGSSGGNFGVGYLATKDGQQAFVKAIDFQDAILATDPLTALIKLAQEANFEKDVLEFCTANRMTRVMGFIGHEYVNTNGNDPYSRVSCLIMEAGNSDLRRLLVSTGPRSCVWNLHVIADVALAISQLHRKNIAHQDIKPSNVISIAEATPKNQMVKLGDMGRVTRKDVSGPYDRHYWPGDLEYCPPERYYNHVPSDWNDAREAADAYMLASLMVFVFTGATLQTLLRRYLPSQYYPENWTGGYEGQLLDVLSESTHKVIHNDVKPNLMREVVDELEFILIQLSNPIPQKRGDAKARRLQGRPVGIDRMESRLRSLANRAAAIARGRGQR